MWWTWRGLETTSCCLLPWILMSGFGTSPALSACTSSNTRTVSRLCASIPLRYAALPRRCTSAWQLPFRWADDGCRVLQENYFLTGCFDKKLRVWNRQSGRVVRVRRCVDPCNVLSTPCFAAAVQIMWQPTPVMVTAAAFNPNGRVVVAGLYNGQCVLYNVQSNGFAYHTQVRCPPLCGCGVEYGGAHSGWSWLLPD